jgi:hypothetical protein
MLGIPPYNWRIDRACLNITNRTGTHKFVISQREFLCTKCGCLSKSLGWCVEV